jgi:hypothetical protein
MNQSHRLVLHASVVEVIPNMLGIVLLALGPFVVTVWLNLISLPQVEVEAG